MSENRRVTDAECEALLIVLWLDALNDDAMPWLLRGWWTWKALGGVRSVATLGWAREQLRRKADDYALLPGARP